MNSAVPDALRPARARFSALVVERAMTLEMLRIDFNNGRDPERTLTEILELAHKIAGVAETIGFPEAGRLAAALERNAGDGLERHTPIKEIWRSVEPRLLALIDELELILDA